MKSVHIRSFSGLYCPAFGLYTEKYGISFRIQSKNGKIRTRKIPNTDTFHVVISTRSNILKHRKSKPTSSLAKEFFEKCIREIHRKVLVTVCFLSKVANLDMHLKGLSSFSCFFDQILKINITIQKMSNFVSFRNKKRLKKFTNTRC